MQEDKISEENITKKGKKKRSLLQRLLRITLLVILLSILIPVIAVQFPPIQTWIVGKVSKDISETLETDVSVGYVNLSIFGKVTIKDIHVSDLERDTLVTVGKLTAKINSIPLLGRPLSFGNLEFFDGSFTLHSDKDGANISKFIKKLVGSNKKSDTKKESKFYLQTSTLKIHNFKYRMLLNNAVSFEEQPHGIIYKNMDVKDINLSADRIILRNDTISFRINALSLSERSGFNLKRLSASEAYVAFGKELNLKDLVLIDDYSNVLIRQFKMQYNGAEEFSHFVNKVRLHGEFENSVISFKTIGFFAPVLRNVSISAMLNGTITGTVSNLKSNNFELKALNNTKIKGNFSINGLPDIHKTIIYGNLTKLTTNKNDVFTALEGITNKDFSKINEFFSEVGFVDFNGTFTGLINDFVAKGNLKSEVGELNIDLKFREPNFLRGNIIATNLDVGRLLKTEIVGISNFNVMVNGKLAGNKTDLFSKGTIYSTIIGGYSYNNINISGKLSETRFNGELSIYDENINLDFSGKIDLKGDETDSSPQFNFNSDIRHLNLVNLNLNKRDSISEFRGKLEANFRGRNILDYVGTIRFSDSYYKDNFGEFDLGYMTLTSEKKDEEKSELTLSSKFVEANFIGRYDIGGLIDDMQNLALIYFPTLNLEKAETALENKPKDKYSLNLKINDKLEGVERIIHHGLVIAPYTSFNMNMDTGNIQVKLVSPNISLNQYSLKDIDLDVNNNNSAIFSSVNTKVASIGGLKFNNLSVISQSKNNNIYTHATFTDSAQRKTGADLYFNTELRYNPEKDKQEIFIDIDTSKLYILDKKWDISKSLVAIKDSGINFSGFKFQRKNQILSVAGAISRNETDSLNIYVEKFGLNTLNYFTERKGYSLGGYLSGKINFYDVYNSAKLGINLTLDTVLVNKDTLGNIIVASMWDNEQERLNIISRIYNSSEVNASINGFYEPKTTDLRFDARLNKFKVKLVEPLLTGILSEIEGYMDGDISLKGNSTNSALGGKVKLDDVGLKVDYLQTKYLVNATVDINENSFVIKDGSLFDNQEHQGILNVEVTHNKFKDIKFNSLATVNTMHSLNTKEKDNHLFYGSAYATGSIRLSGHPKEFNFDITARADDNSILYIPLSNSTEAKKASFLTFKKTKEELEQEKIPERKSNIDLSLDLLVTPSSEIQILIDPKVGDVLRAKGQGNLKIKVNPANNIFDIVGDYEIEKGDYNFALPNFSILSRKFNIEKGSHIRFNGDISSAILNVTASYKERVSLASLIPYDSTYRRYNVNCNIYITGQLTSPSLKFELDFPDLEPEKRSLVQSILNTEEKVTRQFLAILVTRTLIPEQDYGQSDMGSSVLLGNASELLSSQIGELISLFNLPIPLDVNVEYSQDGRNYGKTNYDIDISTQLFDRVVLNGTASSTTQANRSFVGDFEAEVMFGKQGNLRFKAFTKSHDYFSGDIENNRQGVGISYQGQFKNFKDLFKSKKKEKKEKKRKKAIKAKEAIREEELTFE